MGEYFIKDEYEHRTEIGTWEEEVGDYWDPKRQIYSRYLQASAYQKAAELIQQKGLKTVLDVGCGLGHKHMQYLKPYAERCVGVEQPKTVEAAKQMNPEIEFVNADLEQQDQPPHEKFDLVLSVDVIEHLLKPDMLLSYMVEHAHENSLVLISTPERDVRRGPKNTKSPKSEHVREWNQAELRAYMEDRGFEVVFHEALPAFRMGASRLMWHERIRMIRKGIPMNYNQVLVAKAPGELKNGIF